MCFFIGVLVLQVLKQFLYQKLGNKTHFFPSLLSPVAPHKGHQRIIVLKTPYTHLLFISAALHVVPLSN